ncbi:carbamoyl-phosphate synthase [Dentipellis sp. KUC8613]|nr:carbamoyl-phosphate synthase [Dentipellis sp. KUC8613]
MGLLSPIRCTVAAAARAPQRARLPLAARAFHVSAARTLPSPTHPVRAVAAPSVGDFGAKNDGERVLNSPSEVARRISAKVLPKLPRADVRKVVMVGSGGLSIGQAGEFDYSGSQAMKALREEGIDAVLINPNIATWQTSHQLASEVYFLPISVDYVAYVLEKERPDGILLTFGGQSALNVGIELDRMGVLDRLGVKVLGTPIRTLEVSEDRDLFVQALKEIDIPVAHSTAVSTVSAALEAADKIGYPVIMRSAFTLGGLGSGFANNSDELRDLAARGLALSPQVLVERSMKGWKEVEYEVVRDGADNTIICCNMENFDPLGTHTGDSIVVAPSQTLTDDEYHMLRSAALKVIRHLGVVGECNIQYALNATSREYCVIEVNARALASKATGYPLAYTAAKLALGYTLPELPNAVTKTTTACFEPSLDYIVTKIPKWDLAKFSTQVNREVGSSMKSVGEVMAIGRTFEESIMKALRMVDPRWVGFEVFGKRMTKEDMDHVLSNPTDMRIFAIAQAMYLEGYSVDKVHDMTKIDKWFLYKLENIVATHRALTDAGDISSVSHDLMVRAKRMGFSDSHIASLVSSTEDVVRAHRKSLGVTPFVKRIDTLAAEFPAHTNYLYTTYNASTHDVEFDEHGTMVLGSGVYRIGSSVEFDWCAVTCARSLRENGMKTVMVNYNPETVSTDFDEADRLYFEELGWERVMDIYELEGAQGVVVSVGGQLPQNIALRLKHSGVNVLGTDPEKIDMAEDRHKFSSVLDKIGVDQPEWTEVTSVDAAKEFAQRVGYPVLIRPSYVLSGAAMNVVYSESTLEYNLSAAADVSPLHPVVITKFIDGAQEIDVDAVAHKGKLLVHAVSEHVENAGVHSGDATLVLPPFSLDEGDMARLKEIAQKVAAGFDISGPYNMQIIRKQADEPGKPAELKVIECNLRASRSFPFVSKVLGHNFIQTATAAITGVNVPEPVDVMAEKRDYTSIKVAQFSWTRLGGADPFLGVEMASTGEVASFGKDVHEAYWASLLSTTGFKVPQEKSGVLIGGDIKKPEMQTIAKTLSDLGFKLYCSSGVVEEFLNDIPYVHAKRVMFPTKDKRKLREVFDEYDIQCVINLANARASSLTDEDYVARRNAVDFGLPLLNNPRTALLFVEALAKKIPQGGLRSYTEGRIPPEVKSWAEFVGFRA